MNNPSPIPIERIHQAILVIRGQKVMLDHDSADLYDVKTKDLVRSVKRNTRRFPEDFMFRLTDKEFANLRCQIGTSSFWGGRRHTPYAFTEHGVAMLSSVLRSKRAIAVNLEIVRAFIRLRNILATHKDLAEKLQKLEEKFVDHDEKIAQVFQAIRKLMFSRVRQKRRRIGFRLDS